MTVVREASGAGGGRAALLAGVRVLDLANSSFQLCGRLAAELGAEVLHIEPPDGDAARSLGPWPDPAAGGGDPDLRRETGLTWAAQA